MGNNITRRMALVRGSTSLLAGAAAYNGELIIGQDGTAIAAQDGAVPGGHEVARADLENALVRPDGAVNGMSPKWLAEQRLYPEQFGAVGLADDAPAINAALAALGPRGGVVELRRDRKYNINSTITVPSRCAIVGSPQTGQKTGESPSSPRDAYDQAGAVLVVDGSKTITLKDCAALEGVVLMRKGLAVPYGSISDIALARAGVSAFAGVAITIGGVDATVKRCMVLGFNKAIYSSGYARGFFDRVCADCTNGIEIAGSFDITHIVRCHFWPYLTVSYGRPTDLASCDVLCRSGRAIYCHDGADWAKIVDSFSYGYSEGVRVEGANSVTLIGCGADYTPAASPSTSIGFHITGTSKEIKLIGCQAAAQGEGIRITSTGGTTHIIETFTAWACDAWAVNLGSDSAIVSNCCFRGAGAAGGGVDAAAGASFINLSHCVFDGIAGSTIGIAAAPLARSTIFGNQFVNGSVDPFVARSPTGAMTWVRGVESASGVNLVGQKARGTLATPAAAASGDTGVALTGQSYDGATYQTHALVRTEVDGAVGIGDAPGRVCMYTTPDGSASPALRLTLNNGGALYPGADNAQTLGHPSHRWSQLVAGTATISTSDVHAKADIVPIDDALLDAWESVSWVTYRLRDAVAAKDEGARIHTGAIAQWVHAALAGQGIDGFRYGLLCLDDVYEPILRPEKQEDGSVIDRVVGRTHMGKRWGLRYTECFAVEAAYQRRRVAVLEARLDELLARVAALEGAADL